MAWQVQWEEGAEGEGGSRHTGLEAGPTEVVERTYLTSVTTRPAGGAILYTGNNVKPVSAKRSPNSGQQ